MFRRVAVIILVLARLCPANGQTPVGTWSDHLSYNSAVDIAVGTQEVYASTGTSILAYNKAFAELRKLSPVTGLTETGVSAIAWSEENKTLIIGYINTNVDLLVNNTIYNIPDIKNKYMGGVKRINRIRSNSRYAYLASSFGIVVIDLVKKEIHDTWKPGFDTGNNEVWDVAFGNGLVYAATETGIFSATLSSEGLSYFGNWGFYQNLSAERYNSIAFSGNKLFANKSVQGMPGDYIYVVEGNTSSLLSYIPGVFNSSLDQTEDGFSASSPSMIRLYSDEGVIQKTINTFGWASPDILKAIVDGGDIWVADRTSGFVMGKNMSDYTALNLPGPLSNEIFSIESLNGLTIVSSGGVDDTWDNKMNPLGISIYGNKKWETVTSSTITDGIRAVIDPEDKSHFFLTTRESGLLEYKDTELINNYNSSNSPLQTSGLFGIAIDKSGDVWLTRSGNSGNILTLPKGGNLIVNPVTIPAPVVGDIIITKTGHKWIVLPGTGIFILDDRNTPENFSDDRSLSLTVRDDDNRVFTGVFNLTEDLEGNVWLGTDKGPLVYYNPDRVFDENLVAARILMARNDGSEHMDYLLKSERITGIAVDGADRKWIGTAGAGVYHVSSDGTELLKTFNTENSPLFSDSIQSIEVDNLTGDVWIATSEGLQSYRGNATGGRETFSRVYAFPNPVRENYAGNVTITGLIRNSQIRITDVSGNLVFETVSDGGLATWDLKTYNGERVATGVYLIFSASGDGSQSHVTKILVIK